LGNQASSANDSFSNGLLESAQYTRPREWRALEIPSVLVSGDPLLVEEFQFLEGLSQTLEKRADLIEELGFSRQRAISQKLHAIDSRIGKELRAKSEEAPANKPAAIARKKANEETLELLRLVMRAWDLELTKLDSKQTDSGRGGPSRTPGRDSSDDA
jgi:hypothetical protein